MYPTCGCHKLLQCCIDFCCHYFSSLIVFWQFTTCHKVINVRPELASMIQSWLHVVTFFRSFTCHWISLYALICLRSSNHLLQCLCLWYWVLFFFPFILCLLFSNILPLSMHSRGGGRVSVISFYLCVNAKPVWLTDDSTWSGLNHMIIVTRCTCCKWLYAAFLSSPVLFCLTFLPLSTVQWAVWVSLTFPSLHLEGKLWITDAPVVVPMDCGSGSLVTSLGIACTKMSSTYPDVFWSALTSTSLMWQWFYVGALSFTFWVCQSSSPIRYRNIPFGHFCWTQLLYHASMTPHLLTGLLHYLLQWGLKDLFKYLCLYIFFGRPLRPHSAYHWCLY